MENGSTEAMARKPVDWSPSSLVADLATELAEFPAPYSGEPIEAPTIARMVAIRDAAVEMLHAGTHDGDCITNARGACMIHIRMHRIRQATLARALGYGDACTMCKGSKLVANTPSQEAWSEWQSWLNLEADEEARQATVHIRPIPCPVCFE